MARQLVLDCVDDLVGGLMNDLVGRAYVADIHDCVLDWDGNRSLVLDRNIVFDEVVHGHELGELFNARLALTHRLGFDIGLEDGDGVSVRAGSLAVESPLQAATARAQSKGRPQRTVLTTPRA